MACQEKIPPAFIVHGHDENAVRELKDYIQNTLKWQEPVILREQPNCGKTIIEKFEDFGARADFVFVLLTPDDRIYSALFDDDKRRSRQNVIFELGSFAALSAENQGEYYCSTVAHLNCLPISLA